MKVLFITDNFPPEVNAPATRTFEHCKEWVKEGVEVTVITCAPNFPKGKVYKGYKNKLFQKEMVEGIKVIRVWSYIAANQGFVKRIVDFVSFAFMAFWAGLFRKTDLIIATSPQFFTTWTGAALSFFKRKPWIFELRDIWPETIRVVGAIDGDSEIYKLLERIEIWLYKNSNMVLSVTESFKTSLIERGINGDKIRVVRNGANLSRFKPLDKDESLIEKYKLRDKFVLGYVGTHGMTHKLEFILDSWQDVDDSYHLVFLGDGAEKAMLMELTEKLNLTNVTFIDSVSKDKVPAYLSMIDVSLVPLKKSDLFKTVIPSKIFENAAMQIPILLGVEGESKEIIEEYDAGECFEPENKEDFLTKLRILKENSGRYQECQQGCQKLAIDFDRVKMAHKMKGYLEECVKRN